MITGFCYLPLLVRGRVLWEESTGNNMFLLLVLLLALGSAQVVPSFSCWFTTYNNSVATKNLVYSYNNSLSTDVVIAVTDTGNNTLSPSGFNGQQPDIFKSGYNPFTLVLVDAGRVLSQPGGAIVWRVDQTTVTVTQAQLVDTQRCDTAYSGVCPVWVDNFCEDSSYCNGAEGCFSVMIFGSLTTRAMGACTRPQVGVVCPTGQLCSEQSLSCFTPTQAPTVEPILEVVPTFYCWFFTTEPLIGQVLNLALGYNNTASQVLARPLTLAINSSLSNYILPADYNGLQPTLFQTGYDPLAFTLKDSAQVLASGGTIRWTLTIDTLAITLARHILPSTECNLLLSPGDREDTVPTEAPTEEPTSAPTEAPTSECSVNETNCTAFDTFCGGPTECNETTGLCIPVEADYSPCTGEQFQVASDTPVVLICVEELQLCVAYVNCTTDEECRDELFCNCVETCVNGTCYGHVNLTLLELCGAEDAYCNEDQKRCLPNNQDISPKFIVGATAAAALVLFVILIMLCGYFASLKSGKTKNK